ncbi:hypothetical protein KMZ32_01815 [Phycicoccus sp. MAQZ13P-2]|uniref:hypothetical protein n=1 Tax=Phycicoccus mangrovi TaxID=2840470 RepID=UPI001C008398|nr:hypothetical protein [Phycicoccus mangrovi]MBT9254429.1 hypothetical protein [Phycicoccus mangrovi]MBT9272807.1 hypothetical protein [Phycicoccus mangrovi]
MAFHITDFEQRVRAHVERWDALEADVAFTPISPNHGKAVTSAEFDSAGWLASVIVWETGELDLDAGRKADGWLVTKHYNLDSLDGLDEVLVELVALLRDGLPPPEAMTSWLDRPNE